MPSTLFPEIEGSGNALVIDQNRDLQALALDLARLGLSAEDDSSAFDDRRKSSNMTECVPVPSSEHVAEIVGRQGCKIKALRAKTNTYIKTPVRGEEPIFVVTGRKEDVAAAKREILQAAEHFSQIRARRSQGHLGAGVPGQPPPPVPGQTTIQVRVPYRVVGLVVGPKGATIKRIQQQTNTYIVTPSRDNEPVFEVTGMPDSVEKARVDIEDHIALRTGGIIDNDSPQDDFASNGTDTGTFSHIDTDFSFIKPPPLNNPFSPLVEPPKDLIPRSGSTGSDYFYSSTKLSDFSPFLNNYNLNREYNLFNEQVSPDYNIDAFDSLQQSSSWWPETSRNNNPFERTHSFGSVSQLDNGNDINDHKPAMRLRSDPLHGGLSAMPMFAPLPSNSFSSASSDGSVENSPSDSGSSGSADMKKNCMVCTEKDIVAALVPCGHNLFCLDCANQLLASQPTECPVCHQPITQAIQIKSS